MKRENDSGGALLLLACGSPSPRQEFVAAIVRPEIDEADENIGQIGLGLDAVQFTGLYQRSQDRPIFGAVIMTREESILAGKGLRAHRTLDDVGVELDAAIVKKAGEAVPVPEAVADDPGRIRAAREPRELMLEEDLERIDERARSCRDYQEFRARGRFRHWQTNLSPKTTANWVLASNHQLRCQLWAMAGYL